MSVEMQGQAVDLRAVADSGHDAGDAVPHARELVAFAEAVLGDDDEARSIARKALIQAVGPEGFVDAAAVVANFQRMVRIADGSGIPLDTPVVVLSGQVREELGLDAFGAAANTPPLPPALRLLGRVLSPLSAPLFRIIGRRFSGR